MQSDPLHRARGSDGSVPDGPARALDDDTAFRLLGDGRRRAVVRHLASVSRPVRVSDLADVVAASESGTRGAGTATRGNHRQASVALRQVHLPKLVDAGVVIRDGRTDVVAPTPALDALADRLARSSAPGGGAARDESDRRHALPTRVAAAVVAAVATTLVLSEGVAAALTAAVPALVAAGVVALVVFGTLTLVEA